MDPYKDRTGSRCVVIDNSKGLANCENPECFSDGYEWHLVLTEKEIEEHDLHSLHEVMECFHDVVGTLLCGECFDNLDNKPKPLFK